MIHAALVHWLTPGERQRKALPATRRFIALSRFEEDGPQWPDGAWSIEVLFEQPPAEQGDNRPSNASVRFAFDTAPQARLRAGARFGLYEGLHRVADVDVLD